MTVDEFRLETHGIVMPHSGARPLDEASLNRLFYNVAAKTAELIDLPHFREQDTQDLVAAQDIYYVPATANSLISVHALSDVDGSYVKLRRIPLEQAISQDNLNEATYAVSGVMVLTGSHYGKLKITLFPSITTAQTNGLRCLYKRKAQKLQDYAAVTDEIVEFPDSLVEAMPYEIAYLWLIRQGSSNALKQFSVYHDIFVAELNRIRNWATESFNRDNTPVATTRWGGITL